MLNSVPQDLVVLRRGDPHIYQRLLCIPCSPSYPWLLIKMPTAWAGRKKQDGGKVPGLVSQAMRKEKREEGRSSHGVDGSWMQGSESWHFGSRTSQVEHGKCYLRVRQRNRRNSMKGWYLLYSNALRLIITLKVFLSFIWGPYHQSGVKNPWIIFTATGRPEVYTGCSSVTFPLIETGSFLR